MKTAAILTLVLSASAQTYSSHSGWSFTDAVRTGGLHPAATGCGASQ